MELDYPDGRNAASTVFIGISTRRNDASCMLLVLWDHFHTACLWRVSISCVLGWRTYQRSIAQFGCVPPENTQYCTFSNIIFQQNRTISWWLSIKHDDSQIPFHRMLLASSEDSEMAGKQTSEYAGKLFCFMFKCPGFEYPDWDFHSYTQHTGNMRE